MTEGKAVPVKPVVLTFDDGYPDTYSIVMPVMKEFGFPCTVFIPTYDADQGTRLTWQQIQEMKDAGITIASHSYRHERLTELSAAAVEEDVQKSQEELKQRLGIDNEFFCYPYGRVNEAVEDVMKKARHQAGRDHESGMGEARRQSLCRQPHLDWQRRRYRKL